jgi:glycosyltransferase involved in cell wall biosynthesis
VLVGYAPANLSPKLTNSLARLRPLYRRCDNILRNLRPDVIHANDWPVLSVAAKVKPVTGARIVYDSHEFAREEHATAWLWRLLYQPHVCATEAAGLLEADRVVTVSPGIARLLTETYQLAREPTVILNVPNHRTTAPRPIGQRLELLYHGLIMAGRGLETLIMAISQLRRPARLVLRGNGKSSYVNNLRRLAEKHASPGRIVFEPAVPFKDVINAAGNADIGLFTPPITTSQTRYMLPNKLFEYLMAGLMVIFSSGDDVAEIIRQHRCGIVLSDTSASSLAAAIDRLELDEIRDFKNRALKAAHLLCWESEGTKLAGLYTELDQSITDTSSRSNLTM